MSSVVSVGRMFASGGDLLLEQACHAPQVVGGRDQVTGPLGARQSAVAGATEPTDCFQPAEHFLDALADALAGAVSRMPRGAAIDRAAPTAGVLRHMRRDLLVADGRHTRACVVRLV